MPTIFVKHEPQEFSTYPASISYSKLLEDLQNKYKITSHFSLKYIGQESYDDWMILENEQDYEKLMSINKSAYHFLIVKNNKLELTQAMRKIMENLILNYKKRYEEEEQLRRKCKPGNSHLKNLVNICIKISDKFDFKDEIQKRLKVKKERSKIQRFSPEKQKRKDEQKIQRMTQKIESALNQKIKLLIPTLIEKCFQKFECNSCQSSLKQNPESQILI